MSSWEESWRQIEAFEMRIATEAGLGSASAHLGPSSGAPPLPPPATPPQQPVSQNPAPLLDARQLQHQQRPAAASEQRSPAAAAFARLKFFVKEEHSTEPESGAPAAPGRITTVVPPQSPDKTQTAPAQASLPQTAQALVQAEVCNLTSDDGVCGPKQLNDGSARGTCM